MIKKLRCPRLPKWVFPIVALFVISSKANAQFYSFKVDMLGLCTTTIGVEGSAALSNRWTAHLPVRFNPWSVNGTYLKHAATMPGVRYWFVDSYFRGWFLGVNSLITIYNHRGLMGNDLEYFGKDYRYKGWGYGAGVSGGYSRPISRRMNIEFEVGVAGLHVNHDIYNQQDGEQSGHQKGLLLVPGKIAVNLVYLF